MKKISLILLMLLSLSCNLFHVQQKNVQTAVRSVSDARIPPVVRQKLLDFKFDERSSTLSGVANATKQDPASKAEIQVIYDYTFILKDNQLSGNIKMTEIIPGYATSSKQIPVDLHDMLRCCKQAGGKGQLCFDADDDKAIKAAEKEGCTEWCKRVKPN